MKVIPKINVRTTSSDFPVCFTMIKVFPETLHVHVLISMRFNCKLD